MRYAVLDLGTNTFHLLIADAEGDRVRAVFQTTIAVKLGEAGIEKGMIPAQAFQRGLDALVRFKQEIIHYEVKNVTAVATAAIRSANNGGEFLLHVASLTGIRPEIISGDKEAELIWIGVKHALNLRETALIVDIGGGSVEFIIADNQGIHWKQSFPIGAARLMERFHKNDPISHTDIAALTEFLDEALVPALMKIKEYRPQVFVGSAGAFETFAAFQDQTFKPSFENSCFDLDSGTLRSTLNWIINSNHAERDQRVEIVPVRVDMIVTASFLVKYILYRSEIQKIQLSCYSLKEGVLFSLMHQTDDN